MKNRARRTCGWTVTLAGLCALASALSASAQDVPPTPPAAADAPAEPPAPEGTPHRKVILLPVAFTVYESGVGGGLEAVPDWTASARANLGEAATHVLHARAELELVPMPELSPDEQAVLRDHLGLVKLIVTQGSALTGKAWQARRADFDRSLGDGLRFLKDRSGADFAILLDGVQVRQSGGSIFAQIALAALGVAAPGGGGTQLVASVIDLDAGQVQWFNSSVGLQIFGMGGSDVRKSAAAEVALQELFAPYPVTPALQPGK